MSLQKSFFSATLLLLYLLIPGHSFAQETDEVESYSQKIIVQTDAVENIADISVTCFEIPNVLGTVNPSEIISTEYTTDENGEFTVETTLEKNTHHYCEVTEPATDDGCWYFPNQSQRFMLSAKSNNSKPIYLVGLPSPETCNTDQETVDPESISANLPSGTPAPYSNPNVAPTPTPQTESQLTETNEGEITLWQWIYMTIANLFSF